MLEHTNNIKHLCIIALLYSAGLRRSELLNLRLTDIDSKRMLIFIRHSKNNKDRYSWLSQTIPKDLRIYYKKWKPKEYLFEGALGGKYSAESVAKIVRRASAKAGILRKITPQMLSHSFATHLLEDGTGIRDIQTLLRHSA